MRSRNPIVVPPDQEETMDADQKKSQLVNKTWMPHLAHFARRRRQQPPSQQSVPTERWTSRPSRRHGASGSESTLATEATASTASRSSLLLGSPSLSPNHSPPGDNAAATDLEPPSLDDSEDGDGFDRRDDLEVSEDREDPNTDRDRSTAGRRGVTMLRRRPNTAGPRVRPVPRGGRGRTVETDVSTGQSPSLQNAIEDVRDAFHCFYAKFLSIVEQHRAGLALDANGTVLHPALVGCVLGLFLLVLRDLTVLTVCLLATSRILQWVSKWTGYFSGLRVHRDAVKAMRGMVQRVLREGERAVQGDYSRQVMAGYLLYSCTAPGESYVASCIRYRMSAINQKVIQEMEERQLRRLGYQKSERDLFQ